MEMSRFCLTTGIDEQIGKFLLRFSNHFPEDSFPTGHLTFALASTAPEEIVGMCHAVGRHIAQLIGYIGWQQHINGSARFTLHLCLIKEKRIIVAQFALWKAGCVASSQSAPP